MNGLAANGIESTCDNVDMSTIPQAGRSDLPVKPTSEVAHQPGQQPAVSCDDDCGALLNPQTPEEILAALDHWRSHGLWSGCSHGC